MTQPSEQVLTEYIDKARTYLTDTLLPFWIRNSPDPDFGGFLTYFDSRGIATGETDKSFLSQIRMLFTMSSAHRAGYGDGECARLASDAAEFILKHYWDDEHGGWFWMTDRAGRPLDQSKVGYGHCFGVYAFAEYFLATGDPRGREASLRTYQAICENMIDTAHGGFIELMNRDWTPLPPGEYGGDRKSMDVHMHMMEAFTNLYEMTGHPTHRRRVLEAVDILRRHMIRNDSGVGFWQFKFDFTPLPAINFVTSWGRDAEPDESGGHPLNWTSYGHNVEFGWLLLHTARVLEIGESDFVDVHRKVCDQCVEFGIDHEYGGVYCEGPVAGKPTSTEKQFWQQGEIMVGMLDAYRLIGDERYWDAFEKVWRFLFDKIVCWDGGGEWYERVDRQGRPIDDALAHAWKINYHSVRSIIQVVRRLEAIRGRSPLPAKP